MLLVKLVTVFIHPIYFVSHNVFLNIFCCTNLVASIGCQDLKQTQPLDAFILKRTIPLIFLSYSTSTNLQSAGLPWTLAKGQDTFTPISAVVSNDFSSCAWSWLVAQDSIFYLFVFACYNYTSMNQCHIEVSQRRNISLCRLQKGCQIRDMKCLNPLV